MYSLHNNCSYKDLTDYASLCLEYGVKTVQLDRGTYRRVKELNFMSKSSKVVFMGIYFRIKP